MIYRIDSSEASYHAIFISSWGLLALGLICLIPVLLLRIKNVSSFLSLPLSLSVSIFCCMFMSFHISCYRMRLIRQCISHPAIINLPRRSHWKKKPFDIKMVPFSFPDDQIYLCKEPCFMFWSCLGRKIYFFVDGVGDVCSICMLHPPIPLVLFELFFV